MKITVDLSPKSIASAAKALEDYAKSLDNKTSALVDSIGVKGVEIARFNYGGSEGKTHVDTGATLNSIEYEKRNERSGAVTVGGAAVWIEFGTGVKRNGAAGSYVHEKAAELGMSPIGCYGEGHGADPNGWYYPTPDGYKWTSGIKSNPFMYQTSQDLRRYLVAIAQEVFKK